MSLPVVETTSCPPPISADALVGRVVAVTGAYGGLGAAVARQAAKAGATVVLMGYRERPLNRLYDELVALGCPTPAVAPINLESATPDDYAELIGIVGNELGRLDGLVHAAAYFDGLTPLMHFAPDDWLRILQVNLSAPFALTQACMPLLQASADSAVVFVTDDPAYLDDANWGAYGVAKAGLERMASILHAETEHTSLRTHVLWPPPMRTALRRKAWFGENTMRVPDSEMPAAAVVRMLAAAGHVWRGRIVRVPPMPDAAG